MEIAHYIGVNEVPMYGINYLVNKTLDKVWEQYSYYENFKIE